MITIVIMETIKGRTIRVENEVWNWLVDQPGSINDVLRGLMERPVSVGDSPALLEVLELARSQPTTEDVEHIVEATLRRIVEERRAERTSSGYNPASVPGVQVGLQPRPESRSEREARERTERAAALDPVTDPSFDRSDEYVSQS